MIGTKLYIRAVSMRTDVGAHCGAQTSVRIAVRKQKKPKTSTDVGAHAHRMRTECAQMRTAIIKVCPPSCHNKSILQLAKKNYLSVFA